MNRPAQLCKANPSLTWWASTAAESAYVSTTWTAPPSCEMYHSYARVPGSVRVPETISSISSLNVSSSPSLTASSFTQEMCPFIEFSFSVLTRAELVRSALAVSVHLPRQAQAEHLPFAHVD